MSSVRAGGMAEVDGALVDVGGLQKTAEDCKRKLAAESGSRVCAEVPSLLLLLLHGAC